MLSESYVLVTTGQLPSSLNPYCIGRCSLRGATSYKCTGGWGLNPYCIGRCSLSSICNERLIQIKMCLNPYCIGRCSLSRSLSIESTESLVLILIVLEDALWGMRDAIKVIRKKVLILIVLEDALWAFKWIKDWFKRRSLNPYCIGRCSLSGS